MQAASFSKFKILSSFVIFFVKVAMQAFCFVGFSVLLYKPFRVSFIISGEIFEILFVKVRKLVSSVNSISFVKQISPASSSGLPLYILEEGLHEGLLFHILEYLKLFGLKFARMQK